LNVEAVGGGETSSVKFGVDQNDNFRVESVEPYPLFATPVAISSPDRSVPGRTRSP
jgi:hypothetical protein